MNTQAAIIALSDPLRALMAWRHAAIVTKMNQTLRWAPPILCIGQLSCALSTKFNSILLRKCLACVFIFFYSQKRRQRAGVNDIIASARKTYIVCCPSAEKLIWSATHHLLASTSSDFLIHADADFHAAMHFSLDCVGIQQTITLSSNTCGN